MQERTSRFSVTTLVAGMALGAVLAGGGAFAAGQITGKQIKNGTVTSADLKNESIRGKDIKNGTVTGDDVADGSLTNADVSVFFAEVTNTGAVLASSGGVTVTDNPSGSGTSQLDFGRDVTSCTFVGGLGNGAVERAGEVSVVERAGNVNAVYVATFNSAGDPVERAFKVVVVC